MGYAHCCVRQSSGSIGDVLRTSPDSANPARRANCYRISARLLSTQAGVSCLDVQSGVPAFRCLSNLLAVRSALSIRAAGAPWNVSSEIAVLDFAAPGRNV